MLLINQPSQSSVSFQRTNYKDKEAVLSKLRQQTKSTYTDKVFNNAALNVLDSDYFDKHWNSGDKQKIVGSVQPNIKKGISQVIDNINVFLAIGSTTYLEEAAEELTSMKHSLDKDRERYAFSKD